MKKRVIWFCILLMVFGFSVSGSFLTGVDQSNGIGVASSQGWHGPPCDNCDPPDDCNKPGRNGEMSGQS